jgi:hypothetical protein
MTRFIPLTAALFLISGCFAPRLSDWEETQLEQRTADDLDSLLNDLGQVSGGINEAGSGARGDWDACVVAYAGCRACYEASGNLQEGTLSMYLDGIPCSASLTINGTMLGYTIEDRQWTGSWSLRDDAWYDVEYSGFQDAELVVEGSDNWDGTYDSSFTMNQATAVVDGDGNNNGWSVDYAYSGFLDRTWTVTASKSEDGAIEGSVQSDDGVNCTLSGQDYDYVLEC